MTKKRSAIWFVIAVFVTAIFMMIRAQASNIQPASSEEAAAGWISFKDKESAEEVAGMIIYSPGTINGAAESVYAAVPGGAVKVIYQKDGNDSVILQKSLTAGTQPTSSEEKLYTGRLGLTNVSYQGDNTNIHFISWSEADEEGQPVYYTVQVLQDGFSIEDAGNLVNLLSETALNGAVQEIGQ